MPYPYESQISLDWRTIVNVRVLETVADERMPMRHAHVSFSVHFNKLIYIS